MRSWIEQWLTSTWYQQKMAIGLYPLLPFSWLFRKILSFRRLAYQKKWLSSYRSSLPIIVVGNITVGGTGKTPFVIWLSQWLCKQGLRPGIILRGVGGSDNHLPTIVTETTNASQVGDEAMLLSKHTGVSVVVSKNRVAAAKVLETMGHCNIIISDDGLQHYRLQRDIEILLVDAIRQFGNQQLLPAGPLREPLSRINEVDFVVENGEKNNKNSFSVHYTPIKFVSVANAAITKSLAEFASTTVHAIAGIGHPEQFFTMLTSLRLNVVSHIFPDHHAYTASDLIFNESLPIVMTEKDAVKCQSIADNNMWYLAIELTSGEELPNALWKKIKPFMEK